jgi:hypothetical protein
MYRLKSLGITPVSTDVLYSLFSDLKCPENKVSKLESKGLVVRIKRDLYVVSQKVHNQKISSELVANQLYEPSYVSLESALAYYGLIPERLSSIRSVCMKPCKRYETPIGRFEYVRVHEKYYSVGVKQVAIGNSQLLIATPEKALCDKIGYTQKKRIHCVRGIKEYLEKDLKLKMSALPSLNLDIIKECIELGKKKTELTFLLQLLQYGK